MPIIAKVEAASTRRVQQFLARKSKDIVRSLGDEMSAITVDLQTYVKTQKLSGRPGLRNITGNLRRSITRKTIADADQVVGLVGVGPNATKYARIHEFGGTIQFPELRGRLMVFPGSGQVPTRFSKSGKARKGLKAYALSQLVFTMKRKAMTVRIPERSFLRSSLRENKSQIMQRLNTAVVAGAAS